jgi:predicted amidohydrolase
MNPVKPVSVRVGIHQAQPGTGITSDERAFYRERDIDMLVLPEYFWVRPGDADHRQAAAHFAEDLAALAALSREEDWLIVGGTVVEADGDTHHNACPVFHGGVELARYRKIHLMPGEARHGLTPGERFVIVETAGLRVAPVICADVLYPDTFDRVSALEPDLILAPMSSPHRPDDSERDKDARDREIFLQGAIRAGAPIVKAGGMGTLFGRPLQGRSLVATPTGIIFRTPFDEESERRTWTVDVPLEKGQPR